VRTVGYRVPFAAAVSSLLKGSDHWGYVQSVAWMGLYQVTWVFDHNMGVPFDNCVELQVFKDGVWYSPIDTILFGGNLYVCLYSIQPLTAGHWRVINRTVNVNMSPREVWYPQQGVYP